MSEFALSYESCIEAARLASSRGDRLGAEQALAAAIAATASIGWEPQRAAALIKLGELKRDAGDLAEAEEMFVGALEIAETLSGDEDATLTAALTDLAGVRAARGAPEDAEKLLTRALGLAEKRLGREHPDLVVLLNDLSRLYLKRSAYALAEPLLHRLHAIKRLKGEDHAEVATVLASLATVRQAMGDHDTAEQLWRRVLAIRERTLAPNHFAIATAVENLAETCSARGKVSEALRLFHRAVGMREMTLGPAHPSLRTLRERIADLQLQGADEPGAGDDGDRPSLPAPVRIPPAVTYPAVEIPQIAATARVTSPDRAPRPVDRGGDAPRRMEGAPHFAASERQQPAPVQTAATDVVTAEHETRMQAIRELAALSARQGVNAVAAVREPAQRPMPAVYSQPTSTELDTPAWAAAEQVGSPDAMTRAPQALSIILPAPSGDRDDDDHVDDDYDYAVAQTRMQRMAGSIGGIFRQRQTSLVAAGAIAVALIVVAAATASQARGGPDDPANGGIPAQQYVAAGAAALPSDSIRSQLPDSSPAAPAPSREPAASTAPPNRARTEAAAADRSSKPPVAATSAPAPSPRPVELPAALTRISNPALDSALRAAAPGRVALTPTVEKPAFNGGIGAVDYTDRTANRPPLLIGDVPRIPFPQGLRANGRERGGEVIVEFTVDTLGRPNMATVRIVKSDHEFLSSAVNKVIPEMRFVPGTLGGKKAPSKIQMPFSFSDPRS